MTTVFREADTPALGGTPDAFDQIAYRRLRVDFGTRSRICVLATASAGSVSDRISV